MFFLLGDLLGRAADSRRRFPQRRLSLIGNRRRYGLSAMLRGGHERNAKGTIVQASAWTGSRHT